MKEYGLPESHRPYTDKYFMRTNEILQKENINPRVSIKVFARGEGAVAGLDESVAAIKRFARLGTDSELWVTKKNTFTNKEPLMIIKAPVQEVVELETLYLGILSHGISRAAGHALPDAGEIKRKMQRLTAIYGDIPIMYFGARHYHWSLDKEIAAAALEGGAVQTSTDMGSSNIGKHGVGTTPHLLTIVLSAVYGQENATLKTAELFDKHMDPAISRVTLIDTFNREITDALAVAAYFGKRKNSFRVDTCGENVAEGGTFYNGKIARDPTFQTGTGVTVLGVTAMRDKLIEAGYGESTDILLSSSFGNEDKARAFVEANAAYGKRTGFGLFTGVGIGEVSKARFCTADIFEVEDKPLSKTGREAGTIDYDTMRRIR
ncbi:MAG: nicotinate phosphoribosyltransferase [bacterium]|nr:nicotinate phosphoribosyltransferase [bacterium]